MGIYINFTDEDTEALDYACQRTGLTKTNLVRKLVHSYATARLECLDLVSLKGKAFQPKAKAKAPATGGHKRG